MPLHPLKIEEFFRFMSKRESIRRLKEEGNTWPWTDDPILQEYKFTNVKRSDDRTSRELNSQLYWPHRKAPHAEVLLNCAMSRYFGTWEFAVAMGWQTAFTPTRMNALAKARKAAGQRVFTGAYIVPALGMNMPKIDLVTEVVFPQLWGLMSQLIEIVKSTNSWRELILHMRKADGFGGTGFMAKEVVLDTLYFDNFWEGGQPSDFNTWCPAGPGAQRGLRRLMLDPNYKKGLKRAPALEYMLRLFHSAECVEWQRVQEMDLVLHDIQFQLCEFDKYERVLNNQGRPRGKYKRHL